MYEEIWWFKKTTSIMQMNQKKEDNLKNETSAKYEDDLKNEGRLKNKDHLKN